MGRFTYNNETNEKEDGELENRSEELKQNIVELECEEEILQDKEDFGRVQTNLLSFARYSSWANPYSSRRSLRFCESRYFVPLVKKTTDWKKM